MSPIVIVSLSLSGLAIVLGLAWFWVGRLRKSGRARIDAEVLRGRAPQLVDEMANFFGLSSIGAVQARGNGCLVLTDDELAFAQWVPQRLFRVRLADIVAVEETRSHLGKSVARMLLLVRWRSDGADESAAWFVRDLEGWLAALRRHGASAHPNR
ncbi:MAG TPA: hypothetical protein VG755_29475 [Nannocystaceae bacterium]|nr:hypothetical protein [Nannocystaceae bacterium]